MLSAPKIVHVTLNAVYPDTLVFNSARLIMDGIGVGTPESHYIFIKQTGRGLLVVPIFLNLPQC